MSEERAILAGGCFWGMQDLIRCLPGVLSTRVGYCGGDVANATYRNHGTHAEAVEILFGICPATEPDRAQRVHASHLARAHWMTEHGYRQLRRRLPH